jgi:outer membrane receptor protein involved in Fe transport
MIRGGVAAAAAVFALLPAQVSAQTVQSYDIAEQDLAGALKAFAATSGREIIAPSDLVAGKRSGSARGMLSAEQAARHLLEGTGLRLEIVEGAFIIRGPGALSEISSSSGDIVVTGTRIRGHGPVGSRLTAIDRDEIERSGYATTQDIAQTIPQNFGGAPNDRTAAISLDPNSGKNTSGGSSLNLRGLGNGSTLVLLNGDRPPLGGFGGVFSDISMIPAAAIERIEIVADGASAIYGSDAVAGVVNIIPRLAFTGVEASFRFGTADGDSQDRVASLVAGARWASGRAVFAYEYYDRSALAASARDYVTDDLRQFGGPDLRGTYASPGTIMAGGRTFAIPRGQTGRGLRPADLIPDAVNKGDGWDMVDILPRQQRQSLFAAARQELFSGVALYAQGLWSARDYDERERTTSDSPRAVPVTNPFYVDPIGTHRPVRVTYDFGRDLGRERHSGSVEALGLTLGLEARIGAWALDLRGNYGLQTERSRIDNRVNTARLALALADTNPATAYNLFGDGPSTNPATIDYVRGSTVSNNRARAWSGSFRADGPLLRLPAGDLRAAVGSEYRNERYSGAGGVSDTTTLTPTLRAGIPLPGPRRIRAFYGELLIPVFGGDFTAPGLMRLDLSAAVRTERYSDFGSTTNPKLGVNWEPVRGVRLRGTYGKSFRAPNIDNLRQDPGTALLFAFSIPDPASPTGESNILVQRGNDPDLRPEKATTWSLGADFEPRFLPGLRANLTYYNIDYRDRITSPAANLFNFLVNRPTYQGIIQDHPSPATIQAFYASPIFINPLGVDPGTIVALVNAQLQNLSVVKQSGLDAELAYRFGALGGQAEIGARGAYIFHIKQALTPSAPVSDVVDILGNPVDLRVRGRANWSDDRWSLSLFVNYLDSYTNLTNTQPRKVASSTTLDAQIGYRFPQASGPLARLRVAVSATNLVDARPPFTVYNLGLLATGYDPDNASPLGRVVSLQVTKRW